MYRFRYGEFAGKTMEQVILRNPSALYRLVAWAKTKSILPRMQRHFEHLRKRLMRARSVEKCDEPDCKRRAKWLTLPLSYSVGWLPQPYYWCSRHGPHEIDGISRKFPIHFDVIRVFRDKRGQKEISKCV